MKNEIREIDYRKEPGYFLPLADWWNVEKYPCLWTIGNERLLHAGLLALLCSRKCPGKIIRKAHEFAESLRLKCVPVVGGFQSPVEKMCLEVLLKGSQPVVICEARALQGMRVPAEWAPAIEEGRLLIVSPFRANQRRVSKGTAEVRNRLVAASAARVFFLHASPDSRTLALAVELLLEEREIETFDADENENLLTAGARRWTRW